MSDHNQHPQEYAYLAGVSANIIKSVHVFIIVIAIIVVIIVAVRAGQARCGLQEFSLSFSQVRCRRPPSSVVEL